jgi:hypothetical protein
VYLDGPFEAGAEQRLADFVEQQHIEHADVYFNSPGGSLLAGMALGRLLREHGFATDVGRRTADPRRPSDGVCYSACPFAFAGGVRRSLREGSALGVHPAANRVPVPDRSAFERRVAADARDYLVTMGVSPALYDLMAQVPTAGIRLLTREEAESLRLVQGSADARR